MQAQDVREFDGARVVVTGAAGFLGSHVTDALLAADANVLGSDDEVTITTVAGAVLAAVGRHPGIVHVDRTADDPQVRGQDLTLAWNLLGWGAATSLADGLARTVAGVARG